MSQHEKTFVKTLKPRFCVVGVFGEKVKNHWWNDTEYHFIHSSQAVLKERHYPTSMIDKILSDDFEAITTPDYYSPYDDAAYCFSTITEEIEIFKNTYPNYKIISQKIIDEETSVECVQIEYVKECSVK